MEIVSFAQFASCSLKIYFCIKRLKISKISLKGRYSHIQLDRAQEGKDRAFQTTKQYIKRHKEILIVNLIRVYNTYKSEGKKYNLLNIFRAAYLEFLSLIILHDSFELVRLFLIGRL